MASFDYLIEFAMLRIVLEEGIIDNEEYERAVVLLKKYHNLPAA